MKISLMAAVAACSLALSACGGGSGTTAGAQTQQPAMQQSTMQQASKAVAQVEPRRKATTAADYQQAVEQLYVAYFGRPADPNGLTNFENALLAAGAPPDIQDLTAAYATNPAVQTLIDSFGKSTESQNLYGSGSASSFVTAVFENVLGRAPLSAGLTYWSNAISSGSLSEGDAALSIMAGAMVNPTPQGLLDAQLVANRLTVATYFTSQVAAQNAAGDYVGSVAAASARSMLGQVGSSTNTTAFETTALGTIQTMVASAVLVTGTVATGEPLAGAGVVLSDSTGASRSTTAASNGSYTINVVGMTAPFVLTATGPQPNNTASYAGNFSGTYSGGASGSYSLTLLAQGLTSSCSITFMGSSYSCKGVITSSGNLSVEQVDAGGSPSGVVMQGTVTGSCANLSGTWNVSALGLSGNFSGSGACGKPVQVKMVSALASVSASGSNVVNITPLTTAIAAQLTSSGVAADLSAVSDGSAIVSNLAGIDSATQASAATLMAQFGASGSPISTPFDADGQGYDAFYDNTVVGTSPKTSSGVNVFIGPIATQNICWVNAAGTGCTTYSDPGTQSATFPNLCGSDIATGAPIACDPSQPVTSQPSVALPAINSDGGISIAGPGVQFGAPASTTLTSAQCSALSAELAALLGSVPSSDTASWGTLISLLQTDQAQADAACALAGISCAAVDAATGQAIAEIKSYEATYGNQFWGNQCPGQ